MEISDKGVNLIIGHEGLRLKAYLPTPNDKWTIGYGHTSGVTEGMTITKEQAVEYLNQDLAWAESAVNRLVKVPLRQGQFDALVSFVFSIGVANFSKSTLLRKLNVGDYEGAANEFPRWKYQKGVVLRGLVRRRADEMAMFEWALNTKNPAQRVDEVPPLKSLKESKEVWVGSGGVLTGVGALLGGLAPEAQQTLSVALSVALVGFGLWFVYNRISARRKGER